MTSLASPLRTALGLGLGLTLGALSAAGAVAQSQFEWRYYSFPHADVFQTELGLVLGVPETDNVLATAECVIGNSGPYAVLDVAADVSGMADGQSVQITFFSPDGQSQTRDASVTGLFAEFGVTGVSIPLYLDDPLWGMTQTAGRIDYRLAGRNTSMNLPLSQYSIIPVFLNDCRNIDQLAPAGQGGGQQGGLFNDLFGGQQGGGGGGIIGTPAVAQDLGGMGCENFGRVTSVSNGGRESMVFINDSGMYRALYWIDQFGNPVEYGGLNPGQRMPMDTFSGHVWMMAGGVGDCIEMMQVQSGQGTYAMRLPN